MRIPRFLAVAVCLLLAGGCAGSVSPREGFEETPSPAARISAASGDHSANQVDNLWAWSVVAEAPRMYNGDLGANRRFVLAPVGEATGVYKRQGRQRELILRLDPEPGFRIEESTLSEHWVTWREVEDRATKRPEVHIHVADLRRGTTTRLDRVPGVADPGLPPTSSHSGQHLTYTTQDAQATNCIAHLDLASMKGSVVHCTPHKEWGAGFPRYGSGGVTFNQWRPQPRPGGCLSVLVVASGETKAKPVPAQRDCRPFSGVADDDFQFWGEQRPYTPEQADFFAATSDGSIERFGRGDTATEIWCNGWVYWVTHPAEVGELRRWRPGSAVEVVYRNSPSWLTLSVPSCQGDRLNIVRFPNSSADQQLIEATIPE